MWEKKPLIPKILRELGPDQPLDLNGAWMKEKDLEKGLTGETTVRARTADMVAANIAASQKKDYGNDCQRINNKCAEGIQALIDSRKRINTHWGSLKLLLEILAKAVESEDKVMTYDVLWALEANSLFQTAEIALGISVEADGAEAGAEVNIEELYKEKKKEWLKFNQAEMVKQCKERGLETKGSKKDLQARLFARLKEELENPSLTPSASAAEPEKSGKGKDKKASKKDKETDKKSSKKDKGSSKSSSSGSSSRAACAVDEDTEEMILVRTAEPVVSKARGWRTAEDDMVAKQLTDMSHLLPPLSPFGQKFKLDEWQKNVLRAIDNERSVLVCAPTSSGKTVMSSYVASHGGRRKQAVAAPSRPGGNEDEDEDSSDDEPANLLHSASGEPQSVLFVVPSEPLVWQVAAHFAASVGLDHKVAVVSDQMTYAPSRGRDKPSAVVVGTPLALESAITKIRGKVSFHETLRVMDAKEDRSQLAGGITEYKWVVYDEVHSLNSTSPDGAALQRLIKMLNCNFLALSATVGNAEELRSWMENVKGRQLDVECVTAPKEGWEEKLSKEDVAAAEENRLVRKQIHEGRFINLQRHVWTRRQQQPSSVFTKALNFVDDSGLAPPADMELRLLHPLAAVSLEFLQSGGFARVSLPMTSRDSHDLWKCIAEHYPLDKVKHLDPHENFPSSAGRITLHATKLYESKLKMGLEELSRTYPSETQSLLKAFQLEDPPTEYSIFDLVMSLKDVDPSSGVDKLPCLVFHLDIFRLIDRFQQLLRGLESAQRKKHPNYYAEMIAKRQANDAQIQAILKGCVTEEEKELEMRNFTALGEADLEQPHPDFVLSRGVSRTEFDQICKDVAQQDKFGSDASKHALLRALRRGIGLIINEVSFQAYRRAVMRLATRGKLAVVFSDDSLAFGVNMPFRSCVFCGEMGGRLDSLMLQQMSGRAGRRGLDTQGHLVYAGASADFVKTLMLAGLPAVHGDEPRYHTQFLQEIMSKFSNPPSYPHQSDFLGGPSLAEMCPSASNNPDGTGACEAIDANFNNVSRDFLLEFKFIEECDVLPEEELEDFEYNFGDYMSRTSSPSGYRPREPHNPVTLWMMWDMRQYLAESVVLGRLMPFLYEEFAGHNRPANFGDTEEVQIEFIATLLCIIDRSPCAPDSESLQAHPFVQSVTVVKREALRQRINQVDNLLLAYQADVAASNTLHKDRLAIAVPPGEPLDGLLFRVFVEGSVDPSVVPIERREEVKLRLFLLGDILRKLHNAIFFDRAKFGKLELVTRKSFTRIGYLCRDLIQHTIDFPNVAQYEYEGTDISRLDLNGQTAD